MSVDIWKGRELQSKRIIKEYESFVEWKHGESRLNMKKIIILKMTKDI